MKLMFCILLTFASLCKPDAFAREKSERQIIFAPVLASPKDHLVVLSQEGQVEYYKDKYGLVKILMVHHMLFSKICRDFYYKRLKNETLRSMKVGNWVQIKEVLQVAIAELDLKQSFSIRESFTAVRKIIERTREPNLKEFVHAEWFDIIELAATENFELYNDSPLSNKSGATTRVLRKQDLLNLVITSGELKLRPQWVSKWMPPQVSLKFGL